MGESLFPDFIVRPVPYAQVPPSFHKRTRQEIRSARKQVRQGKARAHVYPDADAGQHEGGPGVKEEKVDETERVDGADSALADALQKLAEKARQDYKTYEAAMAESRVYKDEDEA